MRGLVTALPPACARAVSGVLPPAGVRALLRAVSRVLPPAGAPRGAPPGSLAVGCPPGAPRIAAAVVTVACAPWGRL
ncbi:MAG: hypothetical protein QOC64_358, partial [Solirubrobacteraceae bacterium]|nr:hypothetical protein [Solirubrobacteraceae bacterium]